MRRQASSVHLRVITLDKCDFLRSLIGEVVPAMVGVVLYAESACNDM